jgi:hypothetical protein
VLASLLADLPPDLPLLLLGTADALTQGRLCMPLPGCYTHNCGWSSCLNNMSSGLLVFHLFVLADLEEEVQQLFGVRSGGAFQLSGATREQRSAFFRPVAEALALQPPPEQPEEQQQAPPPPPLPRAPEAEAAEAEAKQRAEELAARQRCACTLVLLPRRCPGAAQA